MEIDYLKIAGGMNFLIALVHIAIIFGGPDWYRFFGAGEQMALMAEAGNIQSTLITLFIACVLATWSAYAWSGAGVLPRLPLVKVCLCLITCVYLLRGTAGLIAPLFPDNLFVSQNTASFWVTSSLICLVFGWVHVLGLIQKWRLL